jgi:hypothetical protein
MLRRSKLRDRLSRLGNNCLLEIEQMQKIAALTLASGYATIISFCAAAQTFDEYDVYNRYTFCYQSYQQDKSTYNLGGTAQEWHDYCWKDANISSYVDNCMALDHSWLKWGTHSQCVATAKKLFGYLNPR